MEEGLRLPERLENVTVGSYNQLAEAIAENWKTKGMKSRGQQRVSDIMKSGRLQPATHELPIICDILGCTIQELTDPYFDLGIAEAKVRAQKDIKKAAKYGLTRNAAA